MKNLEVFPGRGLGPLRFGMSIAEVEQIFGEAPESYMEEDGAYSYKVLVYPVQGLSLSFRESYHFRFSSVEVNVAIQNITLFGESLASKSRGQVIDLLRNHLSEEEAREVQEDTFKSLDQRSLWVPSIGMFYFDRVGLLQELQWSPLPDSEGEPIWCETH